MNSLSLIYIHLHSHYAAAAACEKRCLVAPGVRQFLPVVAAGCGSSLYDFEGEGNLQQPE